MQEDELKILADLKTLLVDDFGAIRTQYTMMLGEFGITNIFEASDGKEAWDLISEHEQNGAPFQFIMSDINMPNMNGIQLLKIVRGHPSTRNIPFLIISSENEQETILDAIELKVDNFIIKPIKKQDLRDRLLKIFFS